MDALFQTEAWSSPAGLGLFLISVGVFLYLLSLAEKTKKEQK